MSLDTCSQMFRRVRITCREAISLLAAIGTCFSFSLARAEEPAQPVNHKMSSGLMLGRTTTSDYSGSYAGTAASKDTAGGAFLEYDFTDHVGMQSSAWLLASHNAADIMQGSRTYTGVTRDVTGFALDVVGLLPLGHGFKLLGKAGAFFWSGEISGCGDAFCDNFKGTSLNRSSGVSFTWGAGVRWDFSNRLGVRFDYDNFGQVFDSNMQTISIGVYTLFF